MVHHQFRAAIIAAARKAKPGIPDSDLDAIVGKVAASPGFAGCSDFLSDDLRRMTFADADFESVVRIFATAPAAMTTPKPLVADSDTWARLSPVEKLARHYVSEAGERPDIESVARTERVAGSTASPTDRLQHLRETEPAPTKAQRFAAENPEVRTDDLQEIRDPVKRLAAYRGRVHDTRAVARLKLDQAAYSKKALDPATPPQVRAAANLELARIAERLKALNAA